MWGLTSQPIRHSDKFWRDICPNEVFAAPCTGREQLISSNAASFTQISDPYSGALHECRTGVFSWCVISWFLLSVKREFRNYSSWLVTRRFCVTRGELELLTDIRNFTTLFYVTFRILRPKFSEWLELCIESDLGMLFSLWSLDFAFHDQLLSSIVFKHSF